MRKTLSILPFLTLCVACSGTVTESRPVRITDLPPAEFSTPCETDDTAILEAFDLEDALNAYGVCAGQRDRCAAKVDKSREWRLQAAERANKSGDDE